MSRFHLFFNLRVKVFLIVYFISVFSVVNIGATALVTDAATAIFGEAGVSAATGVMTVCINVMFFGLFFGVLLSVMPAYLYLFHIMYLC